MPSTSSNTIPESDMASSQPLVGQASSPRKPIHDYSISLKDKIIAITGANQGIGLGIAEVCLINAAAHVHSLDISSPGDLSASLSERFPGRFHHHSCDVIDEDSVMAAIAAITGQHGRFDGMVCNAGITRHQPSLDFSMAQVKQLFELNVYGVWNGATAAARTFIKLGCKGSIVFTSSMTSYGANKAAISAPYGGTKAAVRSMAQSMAIEWAEHGIRVNSVSPGFTKTALTVNIEQASDWNLKLKYYRGMGRMALPQELGGAYVYLLSDAASYTTGIDIPVHGAVGAW